MGIRLRTVVFVALLTCVVWGGLTIAAVFYVERSSSQIDKAEMTSALQRATIAIDYKIKQLEVIAGDWAAWDDTYQFVKDRNADYIKANLPDEALTGLGVDFMVFSDLSGRIVYSKAVDPSTHESSALPASIADYLATQPASLQFSSPKDSVAGLLSEPDGVYLIVAQPITSSDLTAKSNGMFFMGHRLGEQELVELKDLTSLQIELFSVQDKTLASGLVTTLTSLRAQEASTPILELNGDSAVGYALVYGLDDQPEAMLRIVLPRTALSIARSAMYRVEWFFAVLFLGLLGLLALVLDRTVLSRLTGLGVAVRNLAATGEGARLPIEGKDEIAQLTGDINEMLDEINRTHAELGYLATHDPLTGLHNRRYFEEALERELGERRRLGTEGALFWFDLDNFKDINDGLGHAAGDELLEAFATHLKEQAREYSVVARLGGDEFGMLVPHASKQEAEATGARLLEALSARMFPAGEHQVRVSVSVGAVFYPEHGDTADDLLARADLAMYDAKARGGNEVIFYTADDSWRSEMTHRIEESERIVSAFRDDRFVLYAQPIFSPANKDLKAYELLLRMIGENGEVVLPRRFLPAADRLGLIRDIDHWVVRRAIRLLADERAKGKDVFFTVNVSAGAFSDFSMLDIIREEFAGSSAEPERLIIEITESTAILDLVGARAFVCALKEIGCRFCLDDFGSGASSFHYLRHLPVDFVKIDGSLVGGLTPDSADLHFLQAIIGLCRAIGIRTVAESVEDANSLRMVIQQNVDFVQGYFLGRPVPAEDYLEDRAPASEMGGAVRLMELLGENG